MGMCWWWGGKGAEPPETSPLSPIGVNLSVSTAGAPHCRDAPWGVSAAAISLQKSQGVRGHPGVFRSDRRHLASDRPSSSWIIGAASETPHGASLQWGAPAVETVKLTPMGDRGEVSGGGEPAVRVWG